MKVGEWKWQKVEIGDGRMKPSGRYTVQNMHFNLTPAKAFGNDFFV